jgi:hypothetical protein
MYDTVVQTVRDVFTIPDKVHDNWKMFAPGVKRIVMSDEECIEFMRRDYGEEYGGLLVEKFNYMKKGAHKADLFRYAWLYMRGGVYMDIKTELIKPFSELFPNNDVCYVVSSVKNKRIYNGIIATPPKNPMILALLKGAMQMTNDKHYFYIVWHGYCVLEKYTNGVKQGLNHTQIDSPDVFVYVEKSMPSAACDNKLDQYNLCMFVTSDDVPMIKLRYQDYPWGSQAIKKGFFMGETLFSMYETYIDSSLRSIDFGEL